MFLFQVNSILEGISCYDEDDAEAIQIASAAVEEVQYLIEELTERELMTAENIQRMLTQDLMLASGKEIGTPMSSF